MSLSASGMDSVGSKASSSRLPNPILNFTATTSSAGSAGAPFNFAPLITTRLSNDNYLYWRAQVASVLRSHLLFGFVDGTFECPSDFIDNPAAADDATAPKQVYNSAFTAWHQQDQAIMSAIRTTSVEAVQGLLLFCSTSHEAWTTLESSFSSQSKARYMHIRRQLSEVKKLDSSAATYFNKVKAMSDTLTSIGQPLRDEEFISYLLNGLDEEYDALFDRVSATQASAPMPIRELYAQLLNVEQRVEARKSVLHGANTDLHSANASSFNNRGGGGKQPFYRADHRGDPRSQPRPFINNRQGGPSGGPNFSGGAGPRQGGDRGSGDRTTDRDGRSGGGGNRPICQICGKVGHIASRCFKRFKQEYLGVDNDGRYMDRQVAAATTSGQTQSYSVEPGWYMDTGATDHLTNELDKLTVKDTYRGNDQIHAANGSGPGHEGNSS